MFSHYNVTCAKNIFMSSEVKKWKQLANFFEVFFPHLILSDFLFLYFHRWNKKRSPQKLFFSSNNHWRENCFDQRQKMNYQKKKINPQGFRRILVCSQRDMFVFYNNMKHFSITINALDYNVILICLCFFGWGINMLLIKVLGVKIIFELEVSLLILKTVTKNILADRFFLAWNFSLVLLFCCVKQNV